MVIFIVMDREYHLHCSRSGKHGSIQLKTLVGTHYRCNLYFESSWVTVQKAFRNREWIYQLISLVLVMVPSQVWWLWVFLKIGCVIFQMLCILHQGDRSVFAWCGSVVSMKGGQMLALLQSAVINCWNIWVRITAISQDTF